MCKKPLELTVTYLITNHLGLLHLEALPEVVGSTGYPHCAFDNYLSVRKRTVNIDCPCSFVLQHMKSY